MKTFLIVTKKCFHTPVAIDQPSCLTSTCSAQVCCSRVDNCLFCFFGLALQVTIQTFIVIAEKGGNPDIVRESQKRRYADVTLVDKVVQLDADWRSGECLRASAGRAELPSGQQAWQPPTYC
jgi:hypothetical protein